jgi:hypothetical protein
VRTKQKSRRITEDLPSGLAAFLDHLEDSVCIDQEQKRIKSNGEKYIEKEPSVTVIPAKAAQGCPW